jgi:hypothetical protein
MAMTREQLVGRFAAMSGGAVTAGGLNQLVDLGLTAKSIYNNLKGLYESGTKLSGMYNEYYYPAAVANATAAGASNTAGGTSTRPPLPSRPSRPAYVSPLPEPKPISPERMKAYANRAFVTAGNARGPGLAPHTSAANERLVRMLQSAGGERVMHPPRAHAEPLVDRTVYAPIETVHAVRGGGGGPPDEPEPPKRFRNYYPKEEAPPKRKRRPRAR